MIFATTKVYGESRARSGSRPVERERLNMKTWKIVIRETSSPVAPSIPAEKQHKKPQIDENTLMMMLTGEIHVRCFRKLHM